MGGGWVRDRVRDREEEGGDRMRERRGKRERFD